MATSARARSRAWRALVLDAAGSVPLVEDRFGKMMCPQSMSRVVRQLGLIPQKARPIHPKRDAKAAERFAKGLSDAVAAVKQGHPDKRLALWFMDEARVGQKGRTGHRWWLRS